MYQIGAVTTGNLAQDDTNTIAAAMLQASNTGLPVTVTLSDGSKYTAGPHDLDSESNTGLIIGAVAVGLGLLFLMK